MSQGYESQLLIEPGQSTHTFDSDSERYTYDSESIRRVTRMVELYGLRGTREKNYARVKTDVYTVGGGLVMRPGQKEIENWLHRIFYGAEESPSDYALADYIPASAYFGTLIDKGGDIHQFNDCVVSRCSFSSSSGQALTMRLDIVGKTESLPSWPGSVPDVFAYDSNSLPVLMSTGTLTLDSTEYNFEDFELVIDNAVSARFGYEETAQQFTPTDRSVTLRVNMDYESTFYGAETPITGSIEFVPEAGKSFKFTFPKLIAGKVTPVVVGKRAIMNNVTLTAYADDYTDYTDYETYVTNQDESDILVPLLLMQGP